MITEDQNVTQGNEPSAMNREYAPHQQRVIDEATELKDKIQKLNDFIRNNDFFKTLEMDEQLRMIKQLAFMQCYFNVLDERIHSF